MNTAFYEFQMNMSLSKSKKVKSISIRPSSIFKIGGKTFILGNCLDSKITDEEMEEFLNRSQKPFVNLASRSKNDFQLLLNKNDLAILQLGDIRKLVCFRYQMGEKQPGLGLSVNCKVGQSGSAKLRSSTLCSAVVV